LSINGAPETGKKENMEKFNHILIVDDEESIRFSLAKYLKDAGYVPHPAATPAAARKMIADRSYAAAIVDRILANGENGLEFLSLLQKEQPFCQKVLISGFPSFESASEAIALKVFAYLAKPVRKDQILQTVTQAVEESRAKSSAALREQIFSHLFDSSPDAVAIYDPAGRAVFVNPAFTHLFGYRREEAVGHELPEIPESQMQRTQRYWAQFKDKGKPVQYESLRLTKDARRLPLLLSLMPIAATEDLPPYTLVIYRESKAIDPEAEKGGSTHTAEADAGRKSDLPGTAFREIAHDFNNIINIILGNSELCRMLLDDNHQASTLLNNIMDAGRRARHLAGKALARQPGEAAAVQPVALDTLAAQTLRLLAPTLPANISLHQYYNLEKPVAAGDFEELQRVLINLLNNAVHAMQPDGGQLEIAIDRHPPGAVNPAPVDESRNAQTLCLSVRDSGCGMDEGLKQRIFEPFYTSKPVGQGSGIGLSGASEIVRGFGGSMHVESEPGNGATFFVCLPEYPCSAMREANCISPLLGV